MGISDINLVTVLIAFIFIIPVLAGVIRPLTGSRIHNSFVSLLNNLALLASVILSVFFTRLILSGGDSPALNNLYKLIPAFQHLIMGKEVLVYLLFLIIAFLAVYGILHLILFPVYKFAVVPASNKLSSALNSMPGVLKRIIGGLWQLPRSIWLVLVFSLLLNFYCDFYSNSVITGYADNSAPYQLVQENVIQPLMNNSIVKNIKIIFNDSFKIVENEVSDIATKNHLIKYFNGVTLDEAVKSNSEIDKTAHKIIGSEKDDKQKAYKIYKWIARNISYDNSKAAIIAQDPSSISSGAIVAYNKKTGVCFDYACLYVAMCRAVGLKVRFLTGLGYTGTSWGDHAWNQVYYPKGNVWINVDTTFGSSGINYFDRSNFGLDHKDGVVQGEWQ